MLWRRRGARAGGGEINITVKITYNVMCAPAREIAREPRDEKKRARARKMETKLFHLQVVFSQNACAHSLVYSTLGKRDI